LNPFPTSALRHTFGQPVAIFCARKTTLDSTTTAASVKDGGVAVVAALTGCFDAVAAHLTAKMSVKLQNTPLKK